MERIQKFYSNKENKHSKLILLTVFLFSTLLSSLSFLMKEQIVNFRETHRILFLWIILLSVWSITILSTLSTWLRILKWKKMSKKVKYTIIFFNFICFSIIMWFSLPIAFSYKNWIWVLIFPACFCLFALLSLIFIKDYKKSLFFRTIILFLIGIIPLIVGVACKNQILIIGGGWVITWIMMIELWELVAIYIFIKKGVALNPYPFAPISIVILIGALLVDSLLNLTFLPTNLFEKLLDDEDEED